MSTWISTDVFRALARFARRYEVTMQGLIKSLIKIEDYRLIVTPDLDKQEWDEYFAARTVTQ